MKWHSMNYSDGLQWELDVPDAVAKCKVIQLASGDWQGRLEWLEDGEKRVMHTEPYESDVDAISATEKLLVKLELQIEGAPEMAKILENWVQVDANSFVPKLPTTHEVVLGGRYVDYGEGEKLQWKGRVKIGETETLLTEEIPSINKVANQAKQLMRSYYVKTINDLNECDSDTQLWYQGNWQTTRDIITKHTFAQQFIKPPTPIDIDTAKAFLDRTEEGLEIEGAPVVDTPDAAAKRLWLPESESCYRPSLETVGGVAEIVRNDNGKWYGAIGVEGYVYTTKIHEEFSDARIETEKLMAAHHVMFATHNPHEDTEAPKQTRFAILTKASHALERGIIKHGNPETSFACIRRLWNAYLQNRPDPTAPLSDSETADLMELMKVGRGQVRPQIDDYVDRAGYAALAGELWERQNTVDGG
jgi:hypothetical protein